MRENMATTIEDIQYDEMLSDLHHEAVMRNEALKQCIYIFVEGESEEATFKALLDNNICQSFDILSLWKY